MVDPQRQLAADPHRRAREAIERVRHAAVGRVLHRHDAELRLAALDFFEHGRDRADRHQLGDWPNRSIAARWLNVNSGPR